MTSRRPRHGGRGGGPHAAGKKKKAAPKKPAKKKSKKAVKAKAAKKKKQNQQQPKAKAKAQAKPAMPEKVLSKKEAKAMRRAIMRQDVRSFVGSRRKEFELREQEAEEQRRAQYPFAAFRDELHERKLHVLAIQREQMRLLRRAGPGRMGELGGTVTRAFSIPEDLDEDLEDLREHLGMGRSEFYETVFEYFLRVYEDD